MKPGDYLFTYGTLRKDERASLVNRPGALFCYEDRINGEIYNLGGFPGANIAGFKLVFNKEQPIVTGDVFQLETQKVIDQCDQYEGYPSFYKRFRRKTESGLIVWVYTYNGTLDVVNLISSGDWKRRNEVQQHLCQVAC